MAFGGQEDSGALRKTLRRGGYPHTDLRVEKSFLHRLVDPIELGLDEEFSSCGDPREKSGGVCAVSAVEELELGRELGRGFQGVVYLATHKGSGKQIAVKVSRAKTESDRKELRGEITVLSGLQHANVVRYYGAIYKASKPPQLYSMYELMDAGCLWKAIQKLGPVPEPVLSQLVGDCLHGLVFLHKSSVLHRDMKTANVLLSERLLSAKLTDFGMSVSADVASSFRGTIEYMAPEKLSGEPYTAKADIWSLGLCVVEARHGAHPFPNRSEYWDLAGSSSHLFGSGAIKGSEALRSFCKACTLRDAGERWDAERLLEHEWITRHRGERIELQKWFRKLCGSEA